jgi:succinate-acetate transporter protein
MRRERALKIVLVVVGLLFTAGVVPLTMFFSREPAVPMIMSIYVTLGIFLLLAVRDPAANRSLIAFGGWANLAHAAVMAAQEYRNVIERQELGGSGCVRNRRCSAGRAGSGKAASRATFC